MKQRLSILALVLALVLLFPACSVAEKIPAEEAKRIALQDAGFAADEVKGLVVQADRDDGRAYYDVSFYKDGTEYEYDIDAKTGAILSADIDAPSK